jgi:hypothetical protein
LNELRYGAIWGRAQLIQLVSLLSELIHDDVYTVFEEEKIGPSNLGEVWASPL